jgi:N-acetylmuramoyl-L-alanine amidase
MNQPNSLIGRLSAGVAALFLGVGMPSHAVTFGQTEVSQRKFVAIAVPRASGYYTLLVLEQRSDEKPCWRESGSSPTRVEPLLLNFNFTKICGRSMDSNGYSIRAAGQDLGLKYQLSLQKQKNDVVLLGLPARSGTSGKPLQLGRTHGIRSGFLKIDLNSGWRFAKRTYSGKPLGHIYFSRDTAATYPIASSPIEKASKTRASKAPRVFSSSSRPLFASSASSSSSDGRASYLVMVITSSATQQAKVRAQQPSAFRTSHQGQTVMQVGTFGDRTKAESLRVNLTRRGFRVLMVTKSKAFSGLDRVIIPSTALKSNLVRIAVPSKKVPLGHARGARGIYASGYSSARRPMRPMLPPPPPIYR